MSKKFMGIVLVTLCTGFTIVSCERDSAIIDVWYGVGGSVTDSVTGDPLEGAIISLNDTTSPDQTVLSDEQGNYRMSVGDLCSCVLFCQVQGYITDSLQVTLTQTEPSQGHIDFQMTR